MRGLRLIFLLWAAEPTWDAGNAFAAQYKAWAELRNVRVQRPADTLSVPEVAEWQKVKSAWRRFESQQDAEYRGGR